METRLVVPRPVRSQPQEIHVRHLGAILGPVHSDGLQEVAAVVQGCCPQAQLHRQVRLWHERGRDEGEFILSLTENGLMNSSCYNH